MWILGISRSHNGAVALINDGKIVTAIQAERITRRKRQAIRLIDEDSGIVSECVSYCLNHAGISHADIGAIAICTPWRIQILDDETLFRYIGGIPRDYRGTFHVPHHMAHCEYILPYANLQPGIALIVDGSGTMETDRTRFNVLEKVDKNCISNIDTAGKETISAYCFDGENASLIYRFSPGPPEPKAPVPAGSNLLPGIGHYWEWASTYCCASRTEAGKIMGLAALGNPDTHKGKKLLWLGADGAVNLDIARLYRDFTSPNVFGSDLSDNEYYADIAAMVQSDTETCLIDILKMLKAAWPADTLYYAGGVALNVVANERIIRSGLFETVVLNGSVEDNGTAVGAALAANVALGFKRAPEPVTDFHGREYPDEDIVAAIEAHNLDYEQLHEDHIHDKVARLLHEGNVVGWLQGRSEFGPRALGARSILANPAFPNMKTILDLHMKHRDRYRPYAPVVLEEYSTEYFDLDGESPVMMREARVLTNDLPAITHADGSARVQTVSKHGNRRLHGLLEAFYKISGFPVLLNTSFNMPGEPIVESPADALNTFRKSALEYVCLGNFLVSQRFDR